MPGTLRRRGRVWWGRVTKDHQTRERSLQTESKTVARQRLQAWVAELEFTRWGKRPTRTLHQACEQFANQHFVYLKPKAAQRYVVSIERLIDTIPNIPLAQIGPKELSDFEKARIGQGVSTATIRRDLACLSSIFSRAEEWEWVISNPVKPFLRGRAKAGLREGAPRDRYLKLWEETALLQEAPERARRAMIVAIDTGIRKGEQFGMLRSDVDLDANCVTVRAEVSKTGVARRVPLWPRSRAIIEAMLAASNGKYLFQTLDGERYSDNSPTMYEALQKACRRAGVTEHVQWHDLRRTCGCRLLQDRQFSMEEVSQWLGHGDIRITQQRYAFLDEDRLLRKVRTAPRASPGMSPRVPRA